MSPSELINTTPEPDKCCTCKLPIGVIPGQKSFYRGHLIYLASPYNHRDPRVKVIRYEAAKQVVVDYLHQGTYIYSPILHNHPVAMIKDLGTEKEWLDYDFTMLRRCDELWILMVPGTEMSSGVRQEIEHAKELRLPIKEVRLANDSPILRMLIQAGV